MRYENQVSLVENMANVLKIKSKQNVWQNVFVQLRQNFYHQGNYLAIIIATREFISDFISSAAREFSKQMSSPHVSLQLRGLSGLEVLGLTPVEDLTCLPCQYFILNGDNESREFLINFKEPLQLLCGLFYHNNKKMISRESKNCCLKKINISFF